MDSVTIRNRPVFLTHSATICFMAKKVQFLCAWERLAGFVQKMNIREGDVIRVYGFFKKNTWTGQSGETRNSLDCTVSHVEIDFRNKNTAAEVVSATPTIAINDQANTAPSGVSLDFETGELPF